MLVWLPGAIASVAWHMFRPIPVPFATALGLALAGAWELTPCKRRARKRCRQGAAEGSPFGFGARNGRLCLISCGPAMAAIVVSGHAPFVIGLIALVMLLEKLAILERLTGIAFGALALGADGVVSSWQTTPTGT